MKKTASDAQGGPLKKSKGRKKSSFLRIAK